METDTDVDGCGRDSVLLDEIERMLCLHRKRDIRSTHQGTSFFNDVLIGKVALWLFRMRRRRWSSRRPARATAAAAAAARQE